MLPNSPTRSTVLGRGGLDRAAGGGEAHERPRRRGNRGMDRYEIYFNSRTGNLYDVVFFVQLL